MEKRNSNIPQSAMQQQNKPVANTRSRRRRNRSARSIVKSAPVLLQTPGYTNSGALMRPRVGLPQMRLPRVSKDGMGFLKCAFAPPDFNADSSSGVPDGFTGKTLVKKHKLVAPLTFNSGTDYYIIIAPIPGISYAILTKGAGSPPNDGDLYNCVSYSDSAQLFGANSGQAAADIVTAFRTVSLCGELVPTTNAVTWSGSIQCFKIPVIETTNLAGVVSGTPGIGYQITGLESVNSTLASQYSAPFNLGVYAFAGNMDTEFTFRPIKEEMRVIPAHSAAGTTFGGFDTAGATSPYTGLGQSESILFKISGLTTNCTALIKTWSCVEYKVNSNSSLYEYTRISPAEDLLALECYRQILMAMPPGVSYYDNAGLWEKILTIIRTVSGAASYIPGPYGMLGRGVNLTAEALSALTL